MCISIAVIWYEIVSPESGNARRARAGVPRPHDAPSNLKFQECGIGQAYSRQSRQAGRQAGRRAALQSIQATVHVPRYRYCVE
eukprot:COSAG02_NODE_691_length_18445_cov_23.541099_9_plen_83_part_00